MKFIKVTVSAWIEVPDELEITTKDEGICVEINGEYFMPYCEWMKWQEHTWITAGDEWEKYDDLHAEDIKIEQLSDEEAWPFHRDHEGRTTH
jgi:hypothetical protein